MQILNCGIAALEKIKAVGTVSAYSLIQMAKENGVNLLVYQVDLKDLPLVPRPAILHSKDHFTYVDNGKALPKHEYSGYVLSLKGLKGARIVPYAEAKRIVGAKKGGSIIGPIVTAVASIINPFLGAAVGAGFAAHQTTGGAGVDNSEAMKGQFYRIPLGAIQGYAQGGGKLPFDAPNALTAAAAAGAAELPSAVESGNYAAPLMAAGGAYLGTKGIDAFKTGFNTPSAPGASSSFLQRTAQGFKNVAGFSGPAQPGAAGYGMNTPEGVYNTGSMSILPASTSAAQGAALLATGGLNLADFARIINKSSSPFSLKNISSGMTAANFLKPGGGESGILGILNQPGMSEAAALAASQIGKPDTSYLDRGTEGVSSDYSALKTYIGDSPLPAATEAELTKYINTPLENLTSELAFSNDTVIRQINQSFDRQIDQMKRSYTGAGQSVTTSSDLRNQIQRIEQDRATSLKEATSELRDANLARAIQAKQFALARGFEQNKFDSGLAFELAKVAGKEKELKLSIDTNNYNQFQDIVANLLYLGYAQKQPLFALFS